jgi:hypothetical protein
LSLEHSNLSHVFRFRRPNGRTDTIPALRLSVIVDMSPHVIPGLNAGKAAFPECVIDTGSHLSVLPESVWGQFKPGVVTPLPFDPAMPASLRLVAIGGGAFTYDLGEVRLRLRDLFGGVMDVTVVAQLTRDAGALKAPMILGLRGGVIDGRVLRAEPDPTAPFGQGWHLDGP